MTDTYVSDWQPRQDLVCHFFEFPICLDILSCFGTHFCDTCSPEFVCIESTLKEHTPCPLQNRRLTCFLIISGTWNIMLCIWCYDNGLCIAWSTARHRHHILSPSQSLQVNMHSPISAHC